LHYLVTGKPAYEGETLMARLLAHRESPIPSLGAEVPEQLQAVFEKMVAKTVENRYQTMSEVVAELEAILGSSGRSAAQSPEEPSSAALAQSLAFLQEDAPLGTLSKQKKPTVPERTQPHVGPKRDTGSNILGMALGAVAKVRRKPLLLVGLGGGLVLLLGFVLTLTLRHGTLVIDIDEQLGKDVQVAVSQGGQKVQLVDAKSGWTLSLGAGKYDLAVQGGDDQFQLDSHTITVTRGGQAKVKVTLKPASLAVPPFDARQARKYQQRGAEQLGVPVEITNSIGMKLVLIPPGEFEMGSPKELIEEQLKARAGDQWWVPRLPGEGPRHRVRITKAFYLGMTEVTQGEYEKVVGTNPSYFSATGKGKDQVAGQDTKRFPVENVSWDDCVEFCRKLSDMPAEKAAGHWYRLPSEAQWEYACRAGSTGRYSFSSGRSGVPREYEEKELVDYGWFDANSNGMPHAVGLKRASAWGLYDMHGNVWEWCQDWYDKGYYTNSPVDDPGGPLGAWSRVGRGGSWSNPAGYCRSAARHDYEHGNLIYYLGFRASLVLADTAAERAKMSRTTDAEKPSGGSTATKPSPAPPIPNPQSPIPPTAGSLIGADGKWQLPPGAPPPAIAPFDAAKAKKHQQGWAKHLGVPVEITNSIGMKLVVIPPGEFTMGSPKELIEEELKAHGDDRWYKDHLPGEETPHQVRTTRPFYLGTYEVTQEEYRRVMGTNPSDFSATGKQKGKVAGQNTKRFPVEQVSWDEAVEFCRKLSEMPEEKVAERTYRLPSEAQWEYACGAGSTGRWCFSPASNVPVTPEQRKHGENLFSDYGWFEQNANGMPHAVGLKRANAWGLYDMHGNVFEWCQDWYDKDYYTRSATDDPGGPPGGSYRVLRGGSWYNPAWGCRSAFRDDCVPGERYDRLGLRVCLVLTDTASRRAKISRASETAQPSGGSTANKPLAFVDPAFQQWVKEVASLPAEQQVVAVAKKLQDLNPGFDGKEAHKIEDGVVTEFGFCTDNVTDISPVRALERLRQLSCVGPGTDRNKLCDLSPLKGMPLTLLSLYNTRVSDLSPLEGMPLKDLRCQSTPLSDLSPLKGMPLTDLSCDNTPLHDLSPLKGMPLKRLSCGCTAVSDLSPLKVMPLTLLFCGSTPVSDLSPLEGRNLTEINFTPMNITKGMDVIRQMKSLKTIGIGPGDKDKFPPAEFWKKYDAGEFNK
ncbi:MAG: SUMF1/EgtB/PvdO family nonheme iron enzyme, partial [Thermoguttaceae bacterium]